jgi:hypothetical protein
MNEWCMNVSFVKKEKKFKKSVTVHGHQTFMYHIYKLNFGYTLA